jgi:hypothetical protein
MKTMGFAKAQQERKRFAFALGTRVDFRVYFVDTNKLCFYAKLQEECD